MNRQQKEAVLMEAMSDKTLSFGCIIEYCWWKYNYIEDYDGCFMKWYNNWEIRDIDEWCWCCSSWSTYTDYKIIWHPVYLHNVLMWARDKQENRMLYYRVTQNEEDILENLIFIDEYYE